MDKNHQNTSRFNFKGIKSTREWRLGLPPNIWIRSFVMIVFLSPSAEGHQEIPLEYKNGKFNNLPQEFEPAEFRMEDKSLKISGKVLVIPEVLARLFPDQGRASQFGDNGLGVQPSQHNVKFLASWNHGPSMLPPYMIIRILPHDENFRFDIYVDLEEVSIMRASVIITSKTNEILAVPISLETSRSNIPKDWRLIIGIWRFGDMVVRISENELKTTEGGNNVEYPTGVIRPDQPGRMILTTPSGKSETFHYTLKDDILVLDFERAPGIGLARFGSESDKVWMKRLDDEP